MSIPDISKFGKRGGGSSESSITSNFSEFAKYLDDTYPKDIKFMEKCYWFFHNINDHPKCCCGKRTKFINFNQGYRTYCSNKCCHNDPTIKEKIAISKDTPEKKKLSVEKRNKTLIDRYGCLCPEVAKERYKQTCLKKWGVENSFQSKEIQKKIANKCLIKYGVIHPMQNDAVKEKHSSSMMNKYGVKNIHQLSYNTTLLDPTEQSEFRKRKCPHPECNMCKEKWYETKDDIYYNRNQFSIEQCTRLHPVGSRKNTNIEAFVKNILNEFNIEYISNSRKIIFPMELDIYIPSKKIAIECNGVYWHSSLKKEHTYHVTKYEMCEKLGIRLITIWEDQIYKQPNKVKFSLLERLDIYKHVINSSDCDIVILSDKKARQFLKDYCMYDHNKSNVRLGLMYKKELISIMIFKQNHKSSNWELITYCCKFDYHINNGASVLLNKFIREYNPKKITSFSFNDIGNHTIYGDLGFESDQNIHSSFWYIRKNDYERFYKHNFTKKQLTDKTSLSNFYYIADSGRKKFVWVKK